MNDFKWEEHKPRKHSFLDREVDVNLKFKPRKMFKFGFFVVLLLLVFYLGRWSIDGGTLNTVEKTQETVKTDSSSLSGLVTGITKTLNSENKPVAKTEPKTENLAGTNNPQKAANLTPATAETTTGSNSVSEENIVTSYNKVSFAISKAKTEWKTTWGKVIFLDFTIKNNEEGTVKPDHFTMKMEGYVDIEKKIPLPPSSQLVKSKTQVSSSALIPYGFAYNELSVGDLKNVEITVGLYDANEKLMASEFKGSFDLSSGAASITS